MSAAKCFAVFKTLANELELERNIVGRDPNRRTPEQFVVRIREIRREIAELPAAEKSAFLRLVVGHISSQWTGSDNGAENPLSNASISRHARAAREILSPWDAMMICADLSIGAIWHGDRQRAVDAAQIVAEAGGAQAGGAARTLILSNEDLDRLRDWRMQALATEPFYFDEKIRLVELSLYQRGQASGADDAVVDAADIKTKGRKGASAASTKSIKILHCLAVRNFDSEGTVPVITERSQPGARRARAKSDVTNVESAAAENYTGAASFEARSANYIRALTLYVSNYGTTIDLDGHLDREPRYPKGVKGVMRTNESDWIATPRATTPGRLEFQFNKDTTSAAAEGAAKGDKYGLDERYVTEVVNMFQAKMSQGPALVHLMEGIDDHFAVSGDSVGTTAHMFIVYDLPESVQPETSDVIESMRPLLLRFCAHYANIETQRAQAEMQKANRQAYLRAAEAQRARNELRDRARRVQNQIKELQAIAQGLNEMIDENQRVSAYLRWLATIDGLFKSENDAYELQNTEITVAGNHNEWTRDQLAAALWTFALPKAPDWAKANISASMLWDTNLAVMDREEILKNPSLHLIHRLKIFDNLRNGLDQQDLESTFSMFKKFRSDQFKDGQAGREEIANIRKFGVREMLFLMGRESFNDMAMADAAKTFDVLEESFSFPSQKMFEGLLQFANAIDKGASDQDVRDALRRTGHASKINIRDGITKEGSAEFPDPGVRIMISHAAADTRNELLMGWRENDAIESDAGMLEVLIRQQEFLSLRGDQRSDDVGKLKLDNFRNLFTRIKDGGGQGTSRHETTNSLLRAMGASGVAYSFERADKKVHALEVRTEELRTMDLKKVIAQSAILTADERKGFDAGEERWMGLQTRLNVEDNPFVISRCLFNPTRDMFLLQFRPYERMSTIDAN